MLANLTGLAATALNSVKISEPSNTRGLVDQSFGSILAGITRDTLRSLPIAENMAGGAMSGTNASPKVVMAILEAERNLQTVIAVRDKIVSAYQEISRMPV